MPVQALVNQPAHVTHGPLGVGELATQAAAILFVRPCAIPLPLQLPAERCVVRMHGGEVCLREAKIRPGPQHLL